MTLDAAHPALPHLLGIRTLSRPHIESLLQRANYYADRNRQGDYKSETGLAGRTIILLFFENSTRTRSSFEIAAKRLGADVINIAVEQSSVAKGETLTDTLRTLDAMHPQVVVMRHPSSGAAEFATRHMQAGVVNAGDGWHEHPTQALLDALTLQRHFKTLEGLNITICGDVLHSRVARSNLWLLKTMGARIRLACPPALTPPDAQALFGVPVFHRLDEAVDGADAIMMLRLQLERMQGAFVPSVKEYHHFYGLTLQRLQRLAPKAVVLHPGPINRGVEIASAVADLPQQSLILEQVEMGVAVRQAVLMAVAQGSVA